MNLECNSFKWNLRAWRTLGSQTRSGGLDGGRATKIIYFIVLALPPVHAGKAGHKCGHGLVGRASLQLVVGRLLGLAFATLEEALEIRIHRLHQLHGRILGLHGEGGLGHRPLGPEHLRGVSGKVARLKLLDEQAARQLGGERQLHTHMITHHQGGAGDPGRAAGHLPQQALDLVLVPPAKHLILPAGHLALRARALDGPVQGGDLRIPSGRPLPKVLDKSLASVVTKRVVHVGSWITEYRGGR